jgi:hypothetical protein
MRAMYNSSVWSQINLKPNHCASNTIRRTYEELLRSDDVVAYVCVTIDKGKRIDPLGIKGEAEPSYIEAGLGA